jgi:hypothetical protein
MIRRRLPRVITVIHKPLKELMFTIHQRIPSYVIQLQFS